MFKCNDQEKVIYCFSNFGPTFGEGFDLKVCDNYKDVNESEAKVNNSYRVVQDEKSENVVINNSVLAGEENFKIQYLEVYQVHFKENKAEEIKES